MPLVITVDDKQYIKIGEDIVIKFRKLHHHGRSRYRMVVDAPNLEIHRFELDGTPIQKGAKTQHGKKESNT